MAHNRYLFLTFSLITLNPEIIFLLNLTLNAKNTKNESAKIRTELEIETLRSGGVSSLIHTGLMSLEFISELTPKEMSRLVESTQLLGLVRDFKEVDRNNKSQLSTKEAEIERAIADIIKFDPAPPQAPYAENYFPFFPY